MVSVGKGLTVGGGLLAKRNCAEDQGPLQVRNTQPAYAVVDLMVRYAVTSSVTLSANLYNAFDKSY